MGSLLKQTRGAPDNLSKFRVNPNLIELGAAPRSDLEFFIPQLVSFCLSDKKTENPYQISEEISCEQEVLQLLSKASQVDFFFAHKVLFYS